MSNAKYYKYIAWKRLTHSGKRSRSEMSSKERQEWDALSFQVAPPINPEEAKQAYLALVMKELDGGDEVPG